MSLLRTTNQKITSNHNQTIAINPIGRPQHNQTVVRPHPVPALSANHNQTLARPLPTVRPQHNQTIVRQPNTWPNHNQTLVRR
jgi:hypothetical protein